LKQDPSDKQPKADSRTPEVDSRTPEVDSRTPEVDSRTPEVDRPPEVTLSDVEDMKPEDAEIKKLQEEFDPNDKGYFLFPLFSWDLTIVCRRVYKCRVFPARKLLRPQFFNKCFVTFFLYFSKTFFFFRRESFWNMVKVHNLPGKLLVSDLTPFVGS